VACRAWASAILLLVPASARGQTAADSASVLAFYQEWFGSAAPGFAGYASRYAADGEILPPNAPPSRGQQAIADWMAQAVAVRSYTIRPSGISMDQIRFLAPEWVSCLSTLTGDRVPKDGGAPVPFQTKYLDLLHRTSSGWEVAYRMWSDNQ
jgi:ketosteroid isomerase-like protein